MATLFPLRPAADALIRAVAGRPRGVRVNTAFEAATLAESVHIVAHIYGAVPGDVPDSMRHYRHGGSALT